MTEIELDAAVSMLRRRMGYRLDGSTRGRLERALAAGALERGEPLAGYVRRLDSDPAELQALLDRLTVQETAFFRDGAHYDTVAREVIPQLSAPVLVWSAGCANGQEAYSLAMLLDEAGLRDWRVIATDVSSRALRRTEAATYSQHELRGVSAERLARHFEPGEGPRTVRSALRKRVEVRRHDLVNEVPPFHRGACGVVFCRNVLIYLEHEAVQAFLIGLHARLAVNALLILGAAESLAHISDTFGLVRLGGTFVYRRPAAEESLTAKPVRGTPGPPVRPAPVRLKAQRAAGPASIRPEARRQSTHAVPQALPKARELVAIGEAAAARGDHAAAARTFRQAAYLEPDHVLAHAMLGLALEGVDDMTGALRAYRASRAALRRVPREFVEGRLDGFSADDLARLLDAKLGDT